MLILYTSAVTMCAGLLVDILAGGLNAAHLPLWARVARRTGGTVILQEGFSGMLGSNIAAALTRKQGADLQLDFACSTGLAVDKVLGPQTLAAPQAGTWQGGSEHVMNGMPARTAAGREAPALEAGQAYAVLLKCTKDLEGRYALVQAVARWRHPTGVPILRVRTSETSSVRKHVCLDTFVVQS
jgi:hypothetical protein